MKAEDRVDIICFSKTASSDISWPLGDVVSAPYEVHAIESAIEKHVNANAGWVLFWDNDFGSPDTGLIQELICKPVDAWHTGINAGLSDKPRVLNFVEPLWMYNTDAAP